jgi:uncharacterized membrane protein
VSPERLRWIVSLVLTVGVLASAVLVAAGFAASFAVGWDGSLLGRPPVAGSVAGSVTDFGGLAAGLADLRPLAIGQLGLLVLVATPILRVVTSLVGFALEGDRLYVAFTAVVLAILLASALLIR